jgi:bacterioferritin-associated ferredoxin
MYVCVCSAITDEDLDFCISENPGITNSQILEELHIAKTCGTCLEELEDRIDRARVSQSNLAYDL